MSDRVFVATFDHEDDLLAATRAVRAKGLRVVDAFTPYAVHGLDRAMGLRRSRLSWVCFICGMIGVAGMLALEHWTAAVDWALDVGGKPWNSLPSDAPVAFETGILLAGLGTVLALFVVCRLYPGRSTGRVEPRVTDDRFVLMVEEDDAAFDAVQVDQLMQQFGVLETEERVLNERGR